MDHTAFLVYFLRSECEVIGPVMQYEKAGVLDAFAGHRDIADVVDSLVYTCIGVEVGAEFHTD